MRRPGFLWIAIALVCAACASCSHELDFGAARVRIAGSRGPVVVHAAVASTESAREHGLMGVGSLGRDSGMLFAFAHPTTRGFWMKDTKIPLSVAFWDRSGRIVAILDMVPCTGDPCRVYSPRRSYVDALEVSSGFFSRHGIAVGAAVRVSERA